MGVGRGQKFELVAIDVLEVISYLINSDNLLRIWLTSAGGRQTLPNKRGMRTSGIDRHKYMTAIQRKKQNVTF